MSQSNEHPNPSDGPGQRRFPWLGALCVLAAIALLKIGYDANCSVQVNGRNQTVSQSDLVRTVTFQLTKRTGPETAPPAPGTPAGSVATPQSTDNGKADCPT